MGSQESIKTFGGHMKADFPFDPKWTNLNHGSFGSIPKAIQVKLREYQDMIEARPDQFLRYEYAELIDESRAAVAGIVHAPVETVVFVSNATEGVNTIFKNLKWNDDGKDVAIYFSTIYEACGKVMDFLTDYHGGDDKFTHKEIELSYPIEDEEILKLFRDAVKQIEADGKRARVCVFDVVTSRPGVLFPWQEMIKTCKELGVMSIVDGAQGIGMVRLNLAEADPDFFVSNCHKWLLVPRGCAVFYVPVRNQDLLPSTLATSHGYAPKRGKRTTPLPPSNKSHFVHNFEFVGTKDNSPYMCVKDAIAYRKDVLGGEERILEYLWDLNKKGGKYVADALGTHVLENSKGTLTNCSMANIALPLWIGERGEGARENEVVIPAEDRDDALQWMMRTFFHDYHTIVPLFWMGTRFWVRISAQIYLDMKDYAFAVDVIKAIVKRVGEGEYKGCLAA